MAIGRVLSRPGQGVAGLGGIAGPLPLPATHGSILMGGREGERAGADSA